MPTPSLTDDGHTVTLDLHGATVDEALHLTRQLIYEADRRGRATVKLIHGSSTSEGRFRNRTIKSALYDALESGQFSDKVTGEWRSKNVLTLSLSLGMNPNGTRLRLLDLTR